MYRFSAKKWKYLYTVYERSCINTDGSACLPTDFQSLTRRSNFLVFLKLFGTIKTITCVLHCSFSVLPLYFEHQWRLCVLCSWARLSLVMLHQRAWWCWFNHLVFNSFQWKDLVTLNFSAKKKSHLNYLNKAKVHSLELKHGRILR